MFILMLVLPLVSALVAGVWGSKLGSKGVGMFSCLTLSLTLWMILITAWKVLLSGDTVNMILWSWLNSGLLNIEVGLQFDSLSCMMLTMIVSISLLVHIYSLSYMNEDPHLQSFMSYLSLFTFFMMVLVTSNNYPQLFMGWEGVGLCSYLLMNFWFTGLDNNKCAIKAMIMNSIGDMGLLLAMFWIWLKVGSLDFASVYSVASISINGWDAICMLILMGAMGKSAQLGLHTWLPDAMAGPTPVSALIHAATMVTAGVYIIMRSSPIFEQTTIALMVVTVVGVLTAFFAATVGILQHDMKKIMAYSTCSQLGYMILACGLSAYSTSLFHLVNHAFFKALLFLSAGSVIHATTNTQDMSMLGNLKKLLPTTYTLMLMGSLSLVGLPFLTGYYSKDLMLELAFVSRVNGGVYWLGTITVLLTAFYSTSLFYLVFLSESKLGRPKIESTEENTWSLILPLLVLAVGSIFMGFITKELMLGPIVPCMLIFSLKWLPSYLMLLGMIFSILLYYNVKLVSNKTMWSNFSSHFYSFIGSAWQFDNLINLYMISNAMKFGQKISYQLVDSGLLEVLGPLGLQSWVIKLSQMVSSLQSGLIFDYALYMLMFLTLFVLM